MDGGHHRYVLEFPTFALSLVDTTSSGEDRSTKNEIIDLYKNII